VRSWIGPALDRPLVVDVDVVLAHAGKRAGALLERVEAPRRCAGRCSGR
jgi:hypothetical protein